MGRVRAIAHNRITLEQGEVPATPGSLYIDCTASALTPRPLLPVFDGSRITLQMVRFPMIPFSAALIAFLEATFADETEKSLFVSPIPLPDTVEDYLNCLRPDMENRLRAARHSLVREWVKNSRLDGYTKIAHSVDRNDIGKQAILDRVKASSQAAFMNLPRLLNSVES